METLDVQLQIQLQHLQQQAEIDKENALELSKEVTACSVSLYLLLHISDLLLEVVYSYIS